MYQRSSRWYDALYSFKDYSSESTAIIELLMRLNPDGSSVLDVGCGTGEHDRHLSDVYHVDGLDLNQEFLTLAAEKNPDGDYYQGDMTNFQLETRYDIVLCLFSTIGYVGTTARLESTLKCFRDHLNPGGVILIEPWFSPERWKPDGKIHMLTAETDRGSICRMSGTETRKNLSIVEFHYMEGTADGITCFTETHTLGIFTVAQMKNAFDSAGLACEYDPEGFTGRGLYTARLKDQ